MILDKITESQKYIKITGILQGKTFFINNSTQILYGINILRTDLINSLKNQIEICLSELENLSIFIENLLKNRFGMEFKKSKIRKNKSKNRF